MGPPRDLAFWTPLSRCSNCSLPKCVASFVPRPDGKVGVSGAERRRAVERLVAASRNRARSAVGCMGASLLGQGLLRAAPAFRQLRSGAGMSGGRRDLRWQGLPECFREGSRRKRVLLVELPLGLSRVLFALCRVAAPPCSPQAADHRDRLQLREQRLRPTQNSRGKCMGNAKSRRVSRASWGITLTKMSVPKLPSARMNTLAYIHGCAC